jgi:hypothetical protein
MYERSLTFQTWTAYCQMASASALMLRVKNLSNQVVGTEI